MTVDGSTTMNMDSCAFLYNKSASLSEKIEFSQKIIDGYCNQDNVEFNSEEAMLQAYFCREILDWITSRVLGKHIKNAADCQPQQWSVWKMLRSLLQATQWTISPTVIALLAGIIEELSTSAKNDVDEVLEDFCSILEILCNQDSGREQVVLHLEHGASLLEACLHMYMRGRSDKVVLKMALLSSKLFTIHMDRFAVEKKVWDAVVVRQFDAVMFGAFYEDESDCTDMKEIRVSIQRSCQMILNHALFALDTLSELADSLSTINEEDSGQSYTRKLLPILNKVVYHASGQQGCQIVASMFSWLLQSYSAKMADNRHLLPEKFQDADSLLFFHLAKMVLKMPDISQSFRMRLVASLTREIKGAGLYRPTGIGGSDQQSFLLEITSMIFDSGMSSDNPDIVSACLQALDGILVVEHRGIEDKLKEYWELMRQVISDQSKIHVVEQSMTLLVGELAKLRRLDRIILSLGGGLQSPDNSLWHFILASEQILESLTNALKHIPSGQSTRFIDCMGTWIKEMHWSSFPYGATIALLILENVPVDLNNAAKVCMYAKDVLKSVQTMLLQHMNDSGCDLLSSLLVIHTGLQSLCMECSKIDPNIAPLCMQGVRPPYWNETKFDKVFNGSIEMFATAEGSDGCVSLPITSLAERAKSLDGQGQARLVYSLISVIRMHLKVRTEQYLYRIHRVLDTPSDTADEYIAGLMEVFSNLIALITETPSNERVCADGFYQLNGQNISDSVVQCLKADFKWLQVGIGCLKMKEQLKLVQQLISMGLIPKLSFCMNHADSLLQISSDLLRTIEHRLSTSGKKRRADGSHPKDMADMFQLPRLLEGSSTTKKNEFQKAMNTISKDCKSDEMRRALKKLIEQHQDDLIKSYKVASMLSKFCYAKPLVSQAVRGICLSHIYYSILIISNGHTELNGAMEKQYATMIDGFCHQTRLLLAHASPEEQSQCSKFKEVMQLYALAESSFGQQLHMLEQLQTIVSGELELLSKGDDFHAISWAVRKDTSLVLVQSICKSVQNESLPFSFVEDQYEDIFHQLSKQTKELCKLNECNTIHSQLISRIAGAASEALPILALHSNAKVRSKLLERMPGIFIACVRELIAQFSRSSSSALRIGHVRKLCAFLETYTQLASSTKPRMPWIEYVNVFSALSTILYVCPKGVGQGHQSRPNAPKEAMIVTASSFDIAGESHRAVLRSVMELIQSSTRDECSRILETLPLNSMTFLEILLVMLEDTENGVLKDLLDNQVDKITYSIVEMIQSAPLHSGSEYTAAEFLHAIRNNLLAPSQEKLDTEFPSNGSYSIRATLGFRCIESIVCRPFRFRKFPKRWIAMILSAVESTSTTLYKHGDDHYDTCFAAMSHILVGIMRHQAVSRTLHIMGLAIRSMQNSLFTMLCVSGQPPQVHVIECFCRVLEEFSKIRAVQPYCKDVILTHVKLFMSPITENALEDSLPLSLCDIARSQGSSGYVKVSSDAQELIAPGICALYGICSADDIQDVYASLGRQATWQSALNNLKTVYESQFRYIGKV